MAELVFTALCHGHYQCKLSNGLKVEIKESGTAYRVFVVGMPNTESETKNKGSIGLAEARQKAALLVRMYQHNPPREKE